MADTSFAFFVGAWVTSSGVLDECRNVGRNWFSDCTAWIFRATSSNRWKKGTSFPAPKAGHMCLARFLIGSLNRLPFRDWPIRESVIPLKWKKSNFHFFLVYIMCNFLYYFHYHTSTWNPVPLQSYSTTFQSVTGPGTSGTGVLKNCSSLFEPCVVWHAKVHFLHIHKVNCQQRPFFYPASAHLFIHSCVGNGL